jgi:hypothetical protein
VQQPRETAEITISIGRSVSKSLWAIGALAYMQVSPPIWGSGDIVMKHGMDVKKKAFCVFEFVKSESTMMVQRRYHTEPPGNNTISGTRNSSRVASCALHKRKG